MHQRKLVAQPRNKSSKLYPSQISYCPKCGGLKSVGYNQCAECRANRPPVIEKRFVVKGEICRKIPLTQRQYAIVNSHLYGRLMQWRWYARWDKNGKRFYAVTNERNKDGVFRKLHMHRLVLEFYDIHTFKMPDHINHNGLDNRISNLRKCTSAQNQANTKIRSDNTSGYRGVKKRKDSGKWTAVIQVNKKAISLGVFTSARKAAIAYDKAATMHCGEFATLNFPRQRVLP